MTEPGFKDHFSAHAASYAAARPDYPDALFRFLAEQVEARTLAWDCATGNGQAARSLARYFTEVIATDASAEQIAAAVPVHGVRYRVANAAACGLPPTSVDLLCVAQALHWFDLDAFFCEAERVLKSAGVLAVWCYGLCTVEPGCDALINALYTELDDYWPPERRLVDSGYRGIELPGRALACPSFAMTTDWSAEDLLAYLRSWSATQRCRRATGSDPTQTIAAELHSAWGRGTRRVTWPLTLKAAIV